MNETALNIDRLAKSYGNNMVLNDISFSINPGESVGLVGVNGAGKSTLIKCLLDFVAFKTGDIKIFDESNHAYQSRRKLAFLPEKFLPPHYLTGQSFLNYMSELYELSVSPQAIETIFKNLDLDLSALNKPVRQFSKGMAQKLGLAACFLSDRDMFILDEPMSGLDPKASAYLKEYLLKLKSTGKTIFFSTHLLNDVESLCDRIIILHQGRIFFDGSTYDCCQHFGKDNLEQAYLACVTSGV